MYVYVLRRMYTLIDDAEYVHNGYRQRPGDKYREHTASTDPGFSSFCVSKAATRDAKKRCANRAGLPMPRCIESLSITSILSWVSESRQPGAGNDDEQGTGREPDADASRSKTRPARRVCGLLCLAWARPARTCYARPRPATMPSQHRRPPSPCLSLMHFDATQRD